MTLADIRTCWVCDRRLDTSAPFVGWDGSRWCLAEPGTEPGSRATHLECSPDPKSGAPMTADDEAALDAGFNPWKTRREMGLLGESSAK
ncbi:MAG TPA: hypothetical protein VFI15_04825 [Candidatus Limnocylindrales bacterium]|nr:hypothetical protein [Candidatus Limnocylindrales bacterium]